MILARLLRSTRADIRRALWHWTKPRKDQVIVTLSCRRVKLRRAHKSTKALDREAFLHTTSKLRRELGVAS